MDCHLALFLSKSLLSLLRSRTVQGLPHLVWFCANQMLEPLLERCSRLLRHPSGGYANYPSVS